MDRYYVVVSRVTEQKHETFLFTAIDSVRRFGGLGETVKILIVDSNSPSRHHLTQYENDEHIVVSSTPNIHYEAGAWLHAYQNYPAKEYLFMHDSSVLMNNPDGCFTNDISVFKIMESWTHEHSGLREWVYEQLKDTPWSNIPPSFAMIQGSIFSAKRHVLDSVYTRGLERILPNHKGEAMGFERLLGIVLCLEGYESQIRNGPHLPIHKTFANRG